MTWGPLDVKRALTHLRARHDGARCAWKDCEDKPLQKKGDFYFGMMMTDAGWRTVCLPHWSEAMKAGLQVWPPFPGGRDE